MIPSIEDGIRARLLEIVAVKNITTTIRPGVLNEDDTLPAIVIKTESELRDNDLEGYGGLTHYTGTIWAISTRWAEMRTLAEAIRGKKGSGLEAWEGTAGGIEFHVESIDGRIFESQELGEGSGNYWHACGLQVRIGYEEDV